MRWIYHISNDDRYRYALGEIQDKPSKLLFVFGINPSKATPEKLDPTARRVQLIAKEHGYDSWIILNVSAQRATNPNDMFETQEAQNKDNLENIMTLLNEYCEYSDILFAYGDLIGKRDYLKKNLCEIISTIKTNEYKGNCYCLGKTKKGNARHPLYQKVSTSFVPYSLDGHTYSEIFSLEDGRCAIRECSDNGDLISEVFGICNSK